MNPLSKAVLLAGAALLCAGAYAACSLTRAGYKAPSHVVRTRIGTLEIREYPALVLAQTPSKHSARGNDGSFMRLFRFIAKGNARQQAIPMTTPVLFRGVAEREAMAFVLPEGVPLQDTPEPIDAAVKLEARDAGTFAVLRMKGGRAFVRGEGERAVRAALEGSGWEPVGEPEFAFYDPPWIPRFLEKNEIQWRVRERGSH